MVLGDASTARSLANQSGIRPVLEQFPDVTIAMVSVGAWRQGASSVWQTVDERLRSEALEAGAVGEIGARLFDASGQPLPTPLDERVLGMTLKELSQIDEVIALGFGRERREAIRAALTGGLVTTLVSDGDLAEALLDET
jgi:DNA-binding transcriptional regulator LsrR (DeoR family)